MAARGALLLRRLRGRTEGIIGAVAGGAVEHRSAAVGDAEGRARLPNADTRDLPSGKEPFAKRGVVPSKAPAWNLVARVNHQAVGAVEVIDTFARSHVRLIAGNLAE